MDRLIKTNYYGIYIHNDNDKWWLISDNEHEEFFEKKRPKQTDINKFRNQIITGGNNK